MNQSLSLIWSIAYIVALFAIFYFLFIRPQKKKDKELKEIAKEKSINVTGLKKAEIIELLNK